MSGNKYSIFNMSKSDQLKRLQARFFLGNVLARLGLYLTQSEVDALRKEATKPFWSKKYKQYF